MIGCGASGRVLPQPRQAPGTVPAWTLFQGAFVEGTTPFDPDDLSDTGTVYDPSTGLITFVTTAAILQRDGKTEALAQFSVPLTSIYPDFDADLDVIELLWVIAAMPDTTGLWGIGIGIFTNAASGHASWGGQRAFLYDSSGAAQVTIAHTSGNILGGSTITATATAFAATFRFFPDQPGGGPACWMSSHVKTAAGWRTGTNDDESLGPTFTTPHVVVSLGKVGTTAAGGLTLSGRLYTRRIRLPLDP